jgi:hypothetical protein
LLGAPRTAVLSACVTARRLGRQRPGTKRAHLCGGKNAQKTQYTAKTYSILASFWPRSAYKKHSQRRLQLFIRRALARDRIAPATAVEGAAAGAESSRRDVGLLGLLGFLGLNFIRRLTAKVSFHQKRTFCRMTDKKHDSHPQDSAQGPILVPVDFSSHSEAALLLASDFAAGLGSHAGGSTCGP